MIQLFGQTEQQTLVQSKHKNQNILGTAQLCDEYEEFNDLNLKMYFWYTFKIVRRLKPVKPGRV